MMKREPTPLATGIPFLLEKQLIIMQDVGDVFISMGIKVKRGSNYLVWGLSAKKSKLRSP